MFICADHDRNCHRKMLSCGRKDNTFGDEEKSGGGDDMNADEILLSFLSASACRISG